MTARLATHSPRDLARRSTTGLVCQACQRADVEVFFEADGVPVHNTLLLDSRAEAVAFPRGDLRLGRCPSCGFIQNTEFDAGLLRYGPGYEDSQAHSPRFVSFATEVARSLIDRHGVRGRDVVEVGSGQGDFLDIVCRLGENRGVGFDPATEAGAVPSSIDHRPESFTAETPVGSLDLLLCRHTLEHIPDVATFVAMLAGHLGRHPGAVGYLEVPDTMRILREGAFWDIYFEHCSYFTVHTFRALLERAGLHVIDAGLGFEGQYVQVEVTSTTGEPTTPVSGAEEVAAAVGQFVERMTAIRNQWRAAFDSWSAARRRVALWGGGSKAVAFISTLGLTDEVAGVVDINPRKHGRFLPGSGHQVLSPAALELDPPDVIIVMNAIYLEEVEADLNSRGLRPEVLAA